MNPKRVLFIQNYLTDPPHLVGKWLEELGFETDCIRAFDGEEIPAAVPSGVSALISLGGAMNALEDATYPWLTIEKTLLRSAVSQGVPVLGICLGAQLLAIALGGGVSRLKENEIGLYSINQVTEDEIMRIGQGAITTQWHEDFVSRLPEGATLIASSDTCPTQIFRVGELSYGLQCHPEADASIVSLREENPDSAFRNFDTSSLASTVSQSIKERELELEQTWKPVIQRWGQEILNRL